MSNEIASIFVSLKADATGLDRQLSVAGRSILNAEKKFGDSMDRMDNKSTSVFARIGKAATASGAAMLSMGKEIALAGGVALGLGAGALTAVHKFAEGIAAIGDEARLAGLQVEQWSQWRHVASQTRIPIDALADGFKELNIRADEFVQTGAGGAAEAFQRLGLTREEVAEKLQRPSEFLLEITERTRALGDRAAGIRIFDEILGGQAGERAVSLLQMSNDELVAMLGYAQQNLTITSETVENAAKLDAAFDRVATTVEHNLKMAVVELAGEVERFLNSLPKSAEENLADFEAEAEATKNTLVQLANAAGNLFPELEPQIREAVIAFLSGQAEAEATKEALLDIAKGRPDLSFIVGDMNGLISTLANVITKANETRAAVAAATMDPVGPGATWEGVQNLANPPRPRVPVLPSRGGTSEAEREKKAYEDMVAELRHELALVGKTEAEKRILNEVRRAGVELASKEGQTIRGLVEEITASETAYADLQSQLETMQGMAGDFFSGLFKDLRQGKSLTDALGDAFGRLADRLMDLAFDSPVTGYLTQIEGEAA